MESRPCRGPTQRVRIKKGQYFILNICLSSDREEELTKQPCIQTPTMDTIEFVVKDRKVVKSQLRKVVNSISALQISLIYPEDFSEEQQGSGVPILISFYVGY